MSKRKIILIGLSIIANLQLALGMYDNPVGASLEKAGVVLSLGNSGTFDAEIVESPAVMFDPNSAKYIMTYTGYGATTGADRASAGYAFSDDLVHWTKQGSLLGPSLNSGDPDENGITGPVLIYENGTYYLFYIGLTQTGYEAGTKRLCYATASSLTGTWTRHGAIISPSGTGWRGTAVYHPSIVKVGSTYYLFFNATSYGNTQENIGYATASSLNGPWTVDDTNSPLLTPTGTDWESSQVGDPSVFQVGSTWFMAYYGYGNSKAADGLAYTSSANFPLGWTRYNGNPVLSPGPQDFDALYAHKPFVFINGGRVFHYYTAVNGNNTKRQIALAVNRPPSVVNANYISIRRTSGDITITNSPSWADIPSITSSMDMTVPAKAGDILEFNLCGRCHNTTGASTYLVFDAQTIVNGTPTNSFTNAGAVGSSTSHSLPGWGLGSVNTTSQGYSYLQGTHSYNVQPADIVNGKATIRLRYFSNSGGNIILSGNDPLLELTLKNLSG